MMKAKTKSFIIILVTLVIGIAIGFEISEILIKKRFDEFRNVGAPRGFVDMFDNIIKPDNTQKPLIDSILLQFHKKTDNIMSASRVQMDKQLDSLKAELKPHLTKEQIERFDNEINRIKKGPRSQPMKNGPPPESMRKGPRPDRMREGPPPGFDDQNPPPLPPQDR
jgi:hypothetical protein